MGFVPALSRVAGRKRGGSGWRQWIQRPFYSFFSRVFPQDAPFNAALISVSFPVSVPLFAIAVICITLTTSQQPLRITSLHIPVSGWKLLGRESHYTYDLTEPLNKQKAQTVDRCGTFKCSQMRFMYERKNKEWKTVLSGMKLHPVFIELSALPQKRGLQRRQCHNTSHSKWTIKKRMIFILNSLIECDLFKI